LDQVLTNTQSKLEKAEKSILMISNTLQNTEKELEKEVGITRSLQEKIKAKDKAHQEALTALELEYQAKEDKQKEVYKIQLDEINTKYETDRDDLNNLFSEAEQGVMELESQLHEQKEKLVASQQEVVGLSTQLDSLRQENLTLRESLAKEQDNTAENKRLGKKIARQALIIEQFKAIAKEYKGDISRLEDTCIQQHKEFEILAEDHTKLRDQVTSLEQQVAQLTEALSSSRNNLAMANHEVSVIETTLIDTRKQLNIARSSMLSLEKEIETEKLQHSQELKELKSSYEGQQQALEQTSRSLEAKHNQTIERLQEQLAQFQEKHDLITEQLQTQTETLAASEKNVVSLGNEIKVLNVKNSNFQRVLQQETGKNKILRKELLQQKQEIASITQSYDDVKEHLKTAKSLNEEQKEQLQTLTTENNRLKDLSSYLQTEVDARDQRIAFLETQLAAMNAQSAAMNAQLATNPTQETLNLVIEQNKALQQQMKALQEQLNPQKVPEPVAPTPVLRRGSPPGRLHASSSPAPKSKWEKIYADHHETPVGKYTTLFTDTNAVMAINFEHRCGETAFFPKELNEFNEGKPMTVKSPSGHTYEFRREGDTPKAVLKNDGIIKIENNKTREQQRLALTIINMIENVRSKSIVVNVDTKDPFIAEIAKRYLKYLDGKGLKTAQHVTVVPDEDNKVNDAEEIFNSLITHKAFENITTSVWYEEAKRLNQPDLRTFDENTNDDDDEDYLNVSGQKENFP
jgi:chromosome segregation ATPase